MYSGGSESILNRIAHDAFYRPGARLIRASDQFPHVLSHALRLMLHRGESGKIRILIRIERMSQIGRRVRRRVLVSYAMPIQGKRMLRAVLRPMSLVHDD